MYRVRTEEYTALQNTRFVPASLLSHSVKTVSSSRTEQIHSEQCTGFIYKNPNFLSPYINILIHILYIGKTQFCNPAYFQHLYEFTQADWFPAQVIYFKSAVFFIFYRHFLFTSPSFSFHKWSKTFPKILYF